MKVRTVDARSMVDIIKTLNEFLPEVTLNFSEDGLRINGIDASKVVLIDIFLPKGYFEEYEVNGEEKVGVRLDELTELFSRVTKEDTLTLSTENGVLVVELEGEYYRKFTVPSIQVESAELPQTELEFPFRAKMITPTFVDIIGGFEDLGADAVRFKSTDGKLTLTAYSDVVESSIELSVDNAGLLEAEGSDAESVYGLEYIANTTKLKRASGSLEIRFGTQLPLKLRYEMPNGGYNDFYIAPRAE
ncbi:MAG: DNA polymerase sliding clamp [Thermoprotei archaeon]